MPEMWVQSQGWEDSLEKEIATNLLRYFCLRKSHWQRSLVGYRPWGSKKSWIWLCVRWVQFLPLLRWISWAYIHAGGKMSSGVSKTTSGFDGSKLEDSADSHVHSYDILEQKETKKISKGKWCMGWSLEEAKHILPGSSSSGVTKDTILSAIRTHVKCCPWERFITKSVPSVFTRGWSRRHPLPSTFQNSRLPERKPGSV